MRQKVMTTDQAAKELGVTRRRIRAMIKAGRLRATRFGQKNWMIQSKELEKVRDRKPGRPPGKRKGVKGVQKGRGQAK